MSTATPPPLALVEVPHQKLFAVPVDNAHKVFPLSNQAVKVSVILHTRTYTTWCTAGMAVKSVPTPWPTLNTKGGGFRGLTTLISNDPTVGLSWLAFLAGNHPSLQGQDVVLFTTADPYVQSHKLLTLRGIRRGQDGVATFLHEGPTRNPGSVTCVTLRPGSLASQIEETLKTLSPSLIVLDLEGFDFKSTERLDLYYRLESLGQVTGTPTVVASRGPNFGDESVYIQAMTVFNATQIWVTRGLVQIPHGPTLSLRAFRRNQLLCSWATKLNEAAGDFSELR